MTRTVPGLLLALVLLLPAVAHAQPTAADRRTGLAPSQPALGTDQLLDYVRAVESLTTEFEWETRGDSRRQLNASRIRMVAQWERPAGGGAPVLVGATIQPVAGGRLHFGGHEINKITINRKGEINIDRKGIDVTVYKVTRQRNGDLVLDLPWWTFGDLTIKAADLGPITLTRWPPTLDELLTSAMAFQPSAGGGTQHGGETQHEGLFTWRLTGQAREHAFPVEGGALRAASRFDIRGGGILRPDGSFETIGTNQLMLELTVGATRYTKGTGHLEADIKRGAAHFNGRYAIAIPASERGAFALTVDGQLDYSVDTNSISLSVPSGARLRGEDVVLSGDGRLVGTIGAGGGAMVLRDGTYLLAIDGPVALSGLAGEGYRIEDIVADGRVTSIGTVSELSTDRLKIAGAWNGEVGVTSRGIRGALEDEEVNARIGQGSRLSFDVPTSSLDVTLPGRPGRNVTLHGDLSGHVAGTLNVDDASYAGTSLEVDASRLVTSFDLDVEGAARSSDPTAPWLRRASGTIGVVAEGQGEVAYTGLPGRPVVPAGHRVVAGDTLGELARRYNVSLADLRAANGIPASSSLIRVGDTLRIPGAEQTSGTAPGEVRSTIDAGSRVDIELDEATLGPGGVTAKGRLSATVQLTGADVLTGRVEAKILGAARATVERAAFELRADSAGIDLEAGPVRVPVRLELDRGSTIHVAVPGRETELGFDRDGSYAEFTVLVLRGEDGVLRVDELQQVDLLLHSGQAAAFAGEAIRVAGEKTIRYTGRVAFVPRGLDLYGDLTVTVQGDERTPIVSVRW